MRGLVVEVSATMRRMLARRLIVAICVFLLLGTTACAMWAEKKNPSWQGATSGEHLEQLFWRDVKAKNWRSLESRMGPMLVTTISPGVMDRAASLEHLKSLDVQEFQIGELDTRPAGTDLIVTYVITLKGTAGGKALATTPIRMMSVWQQLSKGWVLVAQSAVPKTE